MMTLRRFVSWVQATEEWSSRSYTDPRASSWPGRYVMIKQTTTTREGVSFSAKHARKVTEVHWLSLPALKSIGCSFRAACSEPVLPLRYLLKASAIHVIVSFYRLEEVRHYSNKTRHSVLSMQNGYVTFIAHVMHVLIALESIESNDTFLTNLSKKEIYILSKMTISPLRVMKQIVPIWDRPRKKTRWSAVSTQSPNSSFTAYMKQSIDCMHAEKQLLIS